MNQCKNCNKDTINPRFCSRSCSATFNNKLHPKRKPEGTCKKCTKSISSGRTYCSKCYRIAIDERSKFNWANVTLGSIKSDGNANFGSRYPYIRQLARKAYKRSGRGMKCFKCGYHLHVDVCHIKDINAFQPTATIASINDLSNLVALCKNDHWEFDNGHLKL